MEVGCQVERGLNKFMLLRKINGTVGLSGGTLFMLSVLNGELSDGQEYFFHCDITFSVMCHYSGVFSFS